MSNLTGALGKRAFRITAEIGIPTLALVFLPKCPVCLVAYIGLASGLFLSVEEASAVRTLIAVACILFLMRCALKPFSQKTCSDRNGISSDQSNTFNKSQLRAD